MHFFRFFLLSFLWTNVLSLPLPWGKRDQTPIIAGSAQVPAASSNTCDACAPSENIETYTERWFLNCTKPEYRREITNALFYTKGASTYARDLSCTSREYVTLWDVWPEWLYDSEPLADNPLRDIHNDPTKKTQFYETMSAAFARLTRGVPTVMHMSSDYTNPPKDGIWERIEKIVLADQTDVLEMIKVDHRNTQFTRFPLPRKGPKWAIDKAMEEVRKILDPLRVDWNIVSSAKGNSGDACARRGSKTDPFLDSL